MIRHLVVLGPVSSLPAVTGDDEHPGVPISGWWGVPAYSADGRFAFGVPPEFITTPIRDALLALPGVTIHESDGWREATGWTYPTSELEG